MKNRNDFMYFSRYIITSPDRKILTRLELDAFLATAFSPDLNNVDCTQELVVSSLYIVD